MRRACCVLLWAALLAAIAVLPASAQFSGARQQAATVQTGEGVWFYVQLLPGANVSESGLPIAAGFNRELVLDYGEVSSTLGLINLPILGLLYEPVAYAGTFVIVNKSAVPIEITTAVIHSHGPGSKPLGELLYLIPDSQYTGTGNRAASYTFTLPPGGTESMHSVIVTGSLVSNVLGLLVFSPFPTGSYNGFVQLQVHYGNGAEAINVPASLTVY